MRERTKKKKKLSHSAGLHGIYHLSTGARTRPRTREDALALVVCIDIEVYASHV